MRSIPSVEYRRQFILIGDGQVAPARTLPDRICETCKKVFRPADHAKRFCSKPCAAQWIWTQRKRSTNQTEVARHAVSVAIRNGELIRPLYCESCETQRAIHAHHPDYGKPLDVRWLCRSCHIEAHGGSFNTLKRVCKRGHELTPDNLYFSPRGDRRACRACHRINTLASNKRRRTMKMLESLNA